MQRPDRYGAPDPEKCDPIPVEMPLGYMRPTPLDQLIASMVHAAVQREEKEEYETEEESDDFEEENPDLLDLSAYTLDAIQEEAPIQNTQPSEPEELSPEPQPTGDTPDPNASETGEP